jgi:hypothetical protein
MFLFYFNCCVVLSEYFKQVIYAFFVHSAHSAQSAPPAAHLTACNNSRTAGHTYSFEIIN